MSQTQTRDLPRTIGFFGAAGIMIGVTIGSGIFRTPSSIAAELGSPLLILMMWVLGGVLSLFGALTFSELATMYPRSGGIYNFLHQGYGARTAFTFGWTYMLITKPFAASAIALVTMEYFASAIGWKATAGELSMLVCVELIALTGLNVLGMKLGAGVGAAITGAKVVCLIGIVIVVSALGEWDASHFKSVPKEKPLLPALIAVISLVLWTYDGWSDVGSVAGEVRDPQRTLPRVYLIGTVALVALYLAVNAAYFHALPINAMRETNAVASTAVEQVLGASGAWAVGIIVMLATFGSTHASIITGARVTFAQAQDGLLFSFLGRVHPRFETPAVALWVQCLLSCIAVTMLRGFQELADGFVFTMWIFYGLAGASLFVLRRSQPDKPRPFRCPGYPIVPAIFVLASLAMTVLQISADWRGTLPWIGVLLLGLPAFTIWKKLASRPLPG